MMKSKTIIFTIDKSLSNKFIINLLSILVVNKKIHLLNEIEWQWTLDTGHLSYRLLKMTNWIMVWWRETIYFIISIWWFAMRTLKYLSEFRLVGHCVHFSLDIFKHTFSFWSTWVINQPFCVQEWTTRLKLRTSHIYFFFN